MSATSRLVLVLALCVITSLLSPQSTRLVAVRTGQMFDAKAGRLVPDQVVLVSGDRIVEVGPAASVAIPPRRVTQLEKVRFVMKGDEIVKNDLR